MINTNYQFGDRKRKNNFRFTATPAHLRDLGQTTNYPPFILPKHALNIYFLRHILVTLLYDAKQLIERIRLIIVKHIWQCTRFIKRTPTQILESDPVWRLQYLVNGVTVKLSRPALGQLSSRCMISNVFVFILYVDSRNCVLIYRLTLNPQLLCRVIRICDCGIEYHHALPRLWF